MYFVVRRLCSYARTDPFAEISASLIVLLNVQLGMHFYVFAYFDI